MTETVVDVTNLSKKYKIYKNPYARIIEWASFGIINMHSDFWALKNVSFQLKKGECLGIIGPNGAGKSTLLKLISKASWPTTGSISVSGKVVSLLELGAGFHPELTGIQNIYNSASLLGFPAGYVSEKISDIISFAEIGEYINYPVKTYSSGMYVRLAFSLFANLDPDVYIVDEALSVGDIFFQQKCYKRLQQMKEEGVTIILVSHDPVPITAFCDFAMIMDKGEIIQIGLPRNILEIYNARQYANMSKAEKFNIFKSDNTFQYGDGNVQITHVEMVGSDNEKRDIFRVGDYVKIIANFKLVEEIDDVAVGIQLKNRFGMILFGTNSNWLNHEIQLPKKGESFTVEFNLKLNLGYGSYTISVAASNNSRFSEKVFVWQDSILKFDIIGEDDFSFGGEVFLPVEFRQVG